MTPLADASPTGSWSQPVDAWRARQIAGHHRLRRSICADIHGAVLHHIHQQQRTDVVPRSVVQLDRPTGRRRRRRAVRRRQLEPVHDEFVQPGDRDQDRRGGGVQIAGTYPLPNNMQGLVLDDLAVFTGENDTGIRFYVSAGPTGSKTLLVNYVNADLTSSLGWSTASLENNDRVAVRVRRSAEQNDDVVRQHQSRCRDRRTARRVRRTNGWARLSWSDAYPAEVVPASFVGSSRAKAMFALNEISNTITVIPYGVVPWAGEKLRILREYRVEMIEAWTDLIGALLMRSARRPKPSFRVSGAKAGSLCPNSMMTAASPAPIWTGPR